VFPFDIPGKENQIGLIEQKMTAPDFWDDLEESQKVNQLLSGLKERTASFNSLKGRFEDVEVLLDLGREEDDQDVALEVAAEIKKLQRRIEAMELDVILNGPYDRGNAIISLHAGAGGTEAQDWVEMLMRMYMRWAEDHNFKVNVVDHLPGDEAGVKSVTMEITGQNVYGWLRSEKGVHRLVRISPFDAAGRRHTSFASVDVLPEVMEDQSIEIDPDDLKIDTYRSGGAGGQHVNKTDSAVRITHMPTGIVVQCQSERSQISNRNTAMKLLKARLLDLELKKKEAELSAMRDDQMDIAWGSQIRSYVFHPYSMVKDHRTNVEIGNVNGVMDGDIDLFISSFLRESARKQSESDMIK